MCFQKILRDEAKVLEASSRPISLSNDDLLKIAQGSNEC
jgi:hypothetical protein